VIRLGLRLTVGGGREAVTRLILITAAVALGVGLLLVTLAGVNAVNSQNARYAWLETGAQAHVAGASKADPLWWLLTADTFRGEQIGRVDVAATGPTSPVPPGITRLPGPGEYYASPALAALIRSTPASQLADRFPGKMTGTIGDAALPAPNSLVVVVGHTAALLSHVPGATEAKRIATVPPSSCFGENQCIGVGVNANGIDLILSVVSAALLFPVLIFIATATRLSAARREQRFAGMRLAGATPRQISQLAAVESSVAALVGVAAGFGLFFLLRVPIAAIPFTGVPFFPSDLSLSLLDVLIVAIGVPVAAIAAARLALRRVHISPLGVSRRVTSKAPRAWRIIPLLLGIAEMFYYLDRRPPTTPGQVQAYLPGFVLIMAGLILVGPWLTMAGARLMARRTSRPATLIAARRLADDPKAGFRAVSGLVLALFVTTVAVAVITTTEAKSNIAYSGPAVGSTLVDQFTDSQSGLPQLAALASPARVAAEVASIHGVTGTVLVHASPRGIDLNQALVGNGWQVGMGPETSKFPRAYMTGKFPPGMTPPWLGTVPAGLVACAELARVPALGSCPEGARVVAVPAGGLTNGAMQGVIWPAVAVSAQQVAGSAIQAIAVATDGSTQAIEQARTTLEAAYPTAIGQAITLSEFNAEFQQHNTEYQQLADVVILVSMCIAGCTLAASVAAGLTDRKRPFSLLRLTGAPLGTLRRVVGLETAVPLLVSAVLSIGAGFLASELYTRSEQHYNLAAPTVAYYVITLAGLVASLGVIAATFPLLKRITGPESARND
jgi:hypothetical protein